MPQGSGISSFFGPLPESSVSRRMPTHVKLAVQAEEDFAGPMRGCWVCLHAMLLRAKASGTQECKPEPRPSIENSLKTSAAVVPGSFTGKISRH